MKFLVVDDHVLIREALRGVLREIEEQATILEAANSLQAMRLVELHPDLAFILLDIGLPDRDGFTVLTELRQRYPAISVVILSGNNDRNSVVKALDLGALGFIPKSGQREVMLNALRLVFSGGIGEHSPVVRNEICRRLAAVWTTSDPRVLTVPADEAAVMDRESRLLLAASDPPEGAPRQPGVASEDPPGLGS